MVSLEEGIIRLGHKVYEIDRYEVWFSTPRGLSSNIGDAIDVCKVMDVNPEINIKALPVAVAKDVENVYEII